LSNDLFALDKWHTQATHRFAGCVIKQYVRFVWCQVALYQVQWHGISIFGYEFRKSGIAVDSNDVIAGPSFLTQFAYRPDTIPGPYGPRTFTLRIYASTTNGRTLWSIILAGATAGACPRRSEDASKLRHTVRTNGTCDKRVVREEE